MTLSDKFHLCYVNNKDLFCWIREKNLEEKNFLKEKQKWEKLINKEPNFFSDTELLLVYQDILLLKVIDDNHNSFLVKSYKLVYQEICQNIFQEKKNIILINNRQWKEQKNVETTSSNSEHSLEKFVVLFKDEEKIKSSLETWLKTLSIQEKK